MSQRMSKTSYENNNGFFKFVFDIFGDIMVKVMIMAYGVNVIMANGMALLWAAGDVGKNMAYNITHMA